MIKNLIIIALLLILIYGISGSQALEYVQTGLDFLQELVYNMKESVKQ
tara:strand:+ start:2650 stop:2793 length:144 start_codon:yes stop_codon:yes gene_type:complete